MRRQLGGAGVFMEIAILRWNAEPATSRSSLPERSPAQRSGRSQWGRAAGAITTDALVLDKADIAPSLSGKTGTEFLKLAAEDRLCIWPVRGASTRPVRATMIRRWLMTLQP